MRRTTRRRLLLEALGLPLALPLLDAAARRSGGPGGARAVWAEERHPATAEATEGRIRRQAAIQRGCAYLATRTRKDGGLGDNKAVVASTALAVLALMAGGSSDSRGPYGAAVKRGLDFLLGLIENPSEAQWLPKGFFSYTGDNDSRMHGQGYASLALATALGTATQKRADQVRSALVKAVECMETSQTGTGGYGYEPNPASNHEGSVTVAVAQALRAAQDAGVTVNAEVVTDRKSVV